MRADGRKMQDPRRGRAPSFSPCLKGFQMCKSHLGKALRGHDYPGSLLPRTHSTVLIKPGGRLPGFEPLEIHSSPGVWGLVWHLCGHTGAGRARTHARGVSDRLNPFPSWGTASVATAHRGCSPVSIRCSSHGSRSCPQTLKSSLNSFDAKS